MSYQIENFSNDQFIFILVFLVTGTQITQNKMDECNDKRRSLSHCVGAVQNDIQEFIEDVVSLRSGSGANYNMSGADRGKETSNASGNCGSASESPTAT